MCDNVIRDTGAKAIAHALSRNSTLLSLSLRLNRLGDEGGKAIGKALLNNKTLLHLHLGANKVTGPTAIALAQLLAQNNTLRSINLSCNILGEVSITPIINLCLHCSNKQLTVLHYPNSLSWAC